MSRSLTYATNDAEDPRPIGDGFIAMRTPTGSSSTHLNAGAI